MQIQFKTIKNLQTLRFYRYLPTRCVKANPFLGSWVSPTNINYVNFQREGDLKTLQGRVRKLLSHNTPIMTQALNECWFYWRVKSQDQVSPYIQQQFEQDDLKRLIIKLDLSIFNIKGAYTRFLSICAILEYFNTIYKNKLQTVFIVFGYKPDNYTQVRFSKYSNSYKSYYFKIEVVGLLGALTQLNKLYKLGHR